MLHMSKTREHSSALLEVSDSLTVWRGSYSSSRFVIKPPLATARAASCDGRVQLSNLELWCLLTTYRKLCIWAFQRTHYWNPKIQDGWDDPPSWKSTWRHFFFFRGWSYLDKISQTGVEWYVDCGGVVEIKPLCRIPVWRTFGRIQWHVIQEPRITLQSAATWWIYCHDSRVTCHIAWCSHLTK